jgi:heme oxygenase
MLLAEASAKAMALLGDCTTKQRYYSALRALYYLWTKIETTAMSETSSRRLRCLAGRAFPNIARKPNMARHAAVSIDSSSKW